MGTTPQHESPFCEAPIFPCPESLPATLDPAKAKALAALGIRCRGSDQGMLGPVCGLPFAVLGRCMRQDPDLSFVQAGDLALRVIYGPMPVSELSDGIPPDA